MGGGTHSSCEVDGYEQPAEQQHHEQSLREDSVSVRSHTRPPGSEAGSYVPFERPHSDATGRPRARQPHEVTAPDVTGEQRRADLI